MEVVKRSRQSRPHGVHSISPDHPTPSRRRGSEPRSPIKKKETMPDLAYLALTAVCFIALALVVRAVEKL
jgi:hypothetical protein